METQRDIHQRATDDMIEAGLEQQENKQSKFIEIYYSRGRIKKSKPRRWFAENRFQLSAGSNLETLNTISSGTNRVWTAAQISLNLLLAKTFFLIQIYQIIVVNSRNLKLEKSASCNCYFGCRSTYPSI